MNAALALHTVARRYCLERYRHWSARYSELVRSGRDREGNNYTPEALATFPRYNVLNAIRVELERLDPTKLVHLEDTRALLIVAGRTAEDDFTRHPIGVIDQQAAAEERERFCQYVGDRKPSELQAVEALPYRRVLATEEAKSIWSRLRARWQIAEGYWYPLTDCHLPGLTAFNVVAFEQSVRPQQLQSLLAARGIQRVWELREFGPEYEEDIALLEPYYNGAEGFWTSEGMDWLIYASHENSITVAGWILQEIKKLWPSWESHVWTSPFN